MISADDLCDVFVEVADTLVADYGLVDFLYHLSEHVATICDVPAVGILLADDDGRLQYIAASTEQTKLLELFQIQISEGPCFDCFRSGEQVVNSDLSTSSARWPKFAPRAIEAGFNAVHAIPMRLREQVIGTVNIFDNSIGRFDEADIRVVQALADCATIAMIQARHIRQAEALSEQLKGALESRVTIEQAKGALSRMLEVDADQSFALMRAYARANRRQLRDVAQAILTDPASVAPLTAVH